MTHYEQRLQHDLDALLKSVNELADLVTANLRQSVKALLTRDEPLAYRTILLDGPINRSAEALDARCHHFIAKHLPSAGHLRFVSAVIRIVILLERIGDYAVTICRESVQLQQPLSGSFRDEVKAMAEDALQMLGQAMDAFAHRDESLARGTMAFADQVDRDFSVAFNMLVDRPVPDASVHDLFGRLIIIMQLERVSDQAKNLCEQIVFLATGETKSRRPAKILFVDRGDDGLTQMAVAIGTKQCAGRAVFQSAGLEPAAAVDPAVRAFMEGHGYDFASLRPSGFDWGIEGWAGFDVIISLGGPVRDYLDRVPFHSVALQWSPPAGSLEDRYRFLSSAVLELAETMRGPGPQAGT